MNDLIINLGGHLLVVAKCNCDWRLHISEDVLDDREVTLCGEQTTERFVTDSRLVTCEDCEVEYAKRRLLSEDGFWVAK